MDIEEIFQDIYETPVLTEEFITCAQKIYQEIKTNKNNAYRLEVCKKIYDNINRKNVKMAVFLYSMLVNLDYNPEIMKEFIRYVTENETLNYQNKYCLFYQIERIVFLHPEFEEQQVLTAKWELLKQVYAETKHHINMPLHKIPSESCNPNMAVVITEQFLDTNHGPTKTALDRCTILKKSMGKEVLLINTAELQPQNGYLPFLCGRVGNYYDDLRQKESQVWKGTDILYYQCADIMPEAEAYELLLHIIEQIKPMYVINIGGSSLFAGLVDELVPVLTVGTTPSGLAASLTTY